MVQRSTLLLVGLGIKEEFIDSDSTLVDLILLSSRKRRL